MSKALLIFASCFGLGLGLAGSVGTAHACSCTDGVWWPLGLEQITGDGDPAIEAAFWTAEALIVDHAFADLALNFDETEIRLRLVP